MKSPNALSSTSGTALSCLVSRDHGRCCSEIREERRGVDGRQIEHSYSEVGESVGSMESERGASNTTHSGSTADNRLQLRSSHHRERIILSSFEALHMEHQDNNEIKLIRYVLRDYHNTIGGQMVTNDSDR
ncbi:hypothetical protein EYF80_056273 [Liparis tanakae]|uniref:Uncharacterized protein n=1 Tax=Liparis tanakae TaxID=230148 RepID=A0A4Z2EXT8_9TELE|nr:hypothetical protein EYF80_056273 [Liparis tanakae]